MVVLSELSRARLLLYLQQIGMLLRLGGICVPRSVDFQSPLRRPHRPRDDLAAVNGVFSWARQRRHRRRHHHRRRLPVQKTREEEC